MLIQELSVEIGFVKIHLPDYTMSTFMIAQSLADEFGVETNQQAIKKLRARLKGLNNDLSKKVKTDYESGCVFIHASSKRGEEILQVALIINELAIDENRNEIDQEYIDKIRHTLLNWKRPKPQKWKVGDVFSIPLSDDTYSFGQILWEKYRSPNCALFDCKSRENLPIEKVISSPVISVLNVGSECLDSFIWKIIGDAPVKITKLDVPDVHRGESMVGARSFSTGILTDLAEAYYALRPWNTAFGEEDFYDGLLMPTITRPRNVLMK
ncbi:Imm26 family immunity protein [Brevibacillus choshinensis]|nr:Imm26 family immunity protein [Brevibacillus choshinensis]